MKIETSNLEGAALDWAVAKATGYEDHVYTDGAGELRHGVLAYRWAPSTNWTQGGPLIAKLRIDLIYEAPDLWHAEPCCENGTPLEPYCGHYGPTSLIAAMRAIVASELGDTVDVPEELLT